MNDPYLDLITSMSPPPLPPPAPTCTCAYSLGPCPTHGTNHLQGQAAVDAFIPVTPGIPDDWTQPLAHVLPAPPPVLAVGIPIANNPPPKRINVRDKGQRGEREVVKLLQAIIDVVRSNRGLPPLILQRNALQSHLGGEDIYGLAGFSVEVKYQELEYQPSWWQQCLRQAVASNAVPVLFYRKSKQIWRVKLRAYVETPHAKDSIECDVEMPIEDFTEWFGHAYDESVERNPF